jgi:predicted nucleotidyltransferase
MKIDVNRDKIAEFCQKWNIQEFSLFGSALREEVEIPFAGKPS